MTWVHKGSFVLTPKRQGKASNFNRGNLSPLFVEFPEPPKLISVLCTSTGFKPTWQFAGRAYQHLDEEIGRQRGGMLPYALLRLRYPCILTWAQSKSTLEIAPFKWIPDLSIELYAASEAVSMADPVPLAKAIAQEITAANSPEWQWRENLPNK